MTVSSVVYGNCRGNSQLTHLREERQLSGGTRVKPTVWLAAGAAVALASPALAQSPKLEKPHIALSVGGSISQMNKVAYFVALNRKYFEQEGLTVESPAVASGTAAPQNQLADKIKTIADLKGKKIGISAPGAATHNFIAGLMERAGVPWKEASYVSVGTGLSAVAAMRSGGELDALVNLDPAINALVDGGDA